MFGLNRNTDRITYNGCDLNDGANEFGTKILRLNLVC